MDFLRKIFFKFIFSTSILIFFYTFYKSEINLDGSNSNYYKPYYIISVILLIISFFFYFTKDKVKDYTIIIFISFFISLYFFEGYLNFWNYKAYEYKKNFGLKFDTRVKFEIYDDLKKKYNNLSITIPPITYLKKNIDIFPLSGISNSKTIQCNENGYFSIYDSDRYGFNNPDNEWDENEIEFLLVGDSFAHGECVNRPNDIASVLRNLSGSSVLNLGYGGNGPLIEYATLREYMGTNVKKVLWLFFEGNDLHGLKNEFENKILKNYFEDLSFSQKLKINQKKIDIISKNLINNKKKKQLETSIIRTKIIRFIKLSKLRKLLINKPKIISQPLPTKDFEEILKLTKDLTSKMGSELYFVFIPEYNRYILDYDNKSYLSIKKIIKKLNIPFIDIHEEVLSKELDPLSLYPFKKFGHFNVSGYKKIAETIFKLSN